MRRSIIPYALCAALLAGCGDDASTNPTDPVFEGRNFRVIPATSTGTETIRFLIELRIDPERLVFTNLSVDGEQLVATSATKVCPDWCDTEILVSTAEDFSNLGEHRAGILIVDGQNNTAANLIAMFTVN